VKQGLERIRSFYDLSVWLDEVLDALGRERVALAGHDFGGAAAAEYAALFRRRVERLVLLAYQECSGSPVTSRDRFF
jgi:pimeloyl-ACP methyl ester carboxylesterase